MTSDFGGRGFLTKVEITRPDGTAELRTLLFPSTLTGERWMGINICECGESIQYNWDEEHAFRTAVCSACGIVFVIQKP